MITVKELQELLSTFHPDDVVILAKNSEGSSFSPMEHGDSTFYIPLTTWSGELVEESRNTSIPCVVFWPTH
jgi:hypothetical protein